MAGGRGKGAVLIGYGLIGATYAEALSRLEGKVHLAGVLGRSEASGQAFLGAHPALGDVRIYESLDAAIGDPAVDFAILTTPPDTRLEIVEALAAAGKPILMEKPLERSLAAARDICRICRKAGVTLGIVLQHRASLPARTLRTRLAEDGYGALQAVEIHVPWWRDQAYYDEPGRGSYARDGGGVMITQAIHVMDLALQFTGPAAEVTAFCATTGLHRMEAEDFVVAGLRFANGAVGSLFASTASRPGRSEEIVLHYDAASVRLQRSRLQIDGPAGTSEVIGAAGAAGGGSDAAAVPSALHQAVIEDFAACLDSGAEPLASGASALQVHALIEAVERSGRTGARTKVAAADD